MRRRSPRPLAPAVQVLAERLAPQTLLAEIQSAWTDAVGADVARAARPASERDGVLKVVCAASVWAQELELMGPVVVGQLNARLGRSAVRSLRCHVGSIATPPAVSSHHNA